VLEGDIGGDEQSILLDDARGNRDEFGVGSVVEEQVVAEVLLVAAAEVALIAWSRVEGDDAVADSEIPNAGTYFVDNARELMPEGHGQSEHARVIAATVNLEVGATGEGGLDANDDLSRTGNGYREALKAHIFAAV
jgi:hypothetical protein